VTEAEFRALALSFPGAVEGFNMKSAFFKVNGKDLCRLLDADEAMLTGVPVEEIEMLTEAEPATFWADAHFKGGRCLSVILSAIEAETLRPFLERRFREIAKTADVRAWAASRRG
jgi:hypothetical protein